MNYLDFFNTTLSVIIIIFLSTFNIIYLYFRFFFSKEQTQTNLSQTLPGLGCSNKIMEKVNKMEKAMDKYNQAFSYLNNSNEFLSKEYKDIIEKDKDVKKYVNESRNAIQFQR